jgi:hypothetical protein
MSMVHLSVSSGLVKRRRNLLFLQDGHPRQFSSCHKLQGRAAAGRDVRYAFARVKAECMFVPIFIFTTP